MREVKEQRSRKYRNKIYFTDIQVALIETIFPTLAKHNLKLLQTCIKFIAVPLTLNLLCKSPKTPRSSASGPSMATAALAAGGLAAAAGAARRGRTQGRNAKAQAVACRGLAKLKIDGVDLKEKSG